MDVTKWGCSGKLLGSCGMHLRVVKCPFYKWSKTDSWHCPLRQEDDKCGWAANSLRQSWARLSTLPRSPLPGEKTFPPVISCQSWGLWHRLAAGVRQPRTRRNVHCWCMINMAHKCPKLYWVTRPTALMREQTQVWTTGTVWLPVASLWVLPVYVYSSVKLSSSLVQGQKKKKFLQWPEHAHLIKSITWF